MSTTPAHIRSGARRRSVAFFGLASLFLAGCAAATMPAQAERNAPRVRVWTIHYRAHNGADRLAQVLLPASYGPNRNPPLPLVISPHGRGGNGLGNSRFWGNLPAVGRFAVVNPDGMGRRLKRFSFGYRGHIDDLARMPEILAQALPWLRIDRSRIYALGSSMGGQETLLLVARHPGLLAGAAAMDSVTDLPRRYGQMRSLGRQGRDLQSVLRREVGGRPNEQPERYAERSPLALADSIAASEVPLQIWWSHADRIVVDQAHQSGALFRTLRALNPDAPLIAYSGRWRHSTEMRSTSLLPLALIDFGLLRADAMRVPPSVHRVATSAAEEV
jgi:pimeloyl-ACP methyl ester carboxylesterase